MVIAAEEVSTIAEEEEGEGVVTVVIGIEEELITVVIADEK